MSAQHHLRTTGRVVGPSKTPQKSFKLALQKRLAADRAKWQLVDLRWQLGQMTQVEFDDYLHLRGVPERLQ
jgi:hypothetical protein